MVFFGTLPALAQELPESARIVVGFPPGGAVDIVACRLGEQLVGKLAKGVIVDNRPGAAGRFARQSPPDGLPLLRTDYLRWGSIVKASVSSPKSSDMCRGRSGAQAASSRLMVHTRLQTRYRLPELLQKEKRAMPVWKRRFNCPRRSRGRGGSRCRASSSPGR